MTDSTADAPPDLPSFDEARARLLRGLWSEEDDAARKRLLCKSPELVDRDLLRIVHGLANAASHAADHATAWAWMLISRLVVEQLRQPALRASHLAQQGIIEFRQGACRAH